MGLLSQAAIKKYLADGSLKIEPAPHADDFDVDSVEAHISDRIYTWKQPAGGAVMTIPLWKGPSGRFEYKAFAKEYLHQVHVDPDGIITMRPNTFYLADLKQYITLPSSLAMHVQGKSSLARLGLSVHITAPHAHAGWEGQLALEMLNSGPFELQLKPGVPIAQLTFWTIEGEIEPRVGQTFQAQRRATGETS